MIDPIVDEIRRVRDEHAASFNYDLDAIFQDIKEQEKKCGHKFVAGVAKPAAQSLKLPPFTSEQVQVTGDEFHAQE